MVEATKGIFQTGPKDELIVKDPTSEGILERVNRKAGEKIESFSDIGTLISSSGLSSSDVTDALKPTEDGIQVDKGKFLSKLERALGVPSGLSSGSERGINGLIKSGLGVVGDRGVSVVVNGVARVIQGDELDVRVITGLLNDLTGSDVAKLIDMEGQFGILNGLIGQAMEWGLPEMVDQLLELAKESKTKRELLYQTAIRAANRGDLHLCDTITRKLGGEAALYEAELIEGLMESYSIPAEETMTYAQLADKMIALFNYINPDWLRGGGQLVSMRYFIRINRDCEAILARSPLAVYAVSGSSLEVDDSRSIINQSFPEYKD